MRMVVQDMSTRYRQWCDEFLANGLDGRAACIKLGYQGEPRRQARIILKVPIVKAYIEQELKLVREQHWVRREQLLEKMRRLNDFNLMRVATRSGSGWVEVNVDDYERVADEIGDCVTEVEIRDNGSVRIKLMDKDRNFDRELKYHGVMDMDGNVNVQINNDNRQVAGIDWDQMCEPPRAEDDVIEARIVDAAKPQTQIDEAW